MDTTLTLTRRDVFAFVYPEVPEPSLVTISANRHGTDNLDSVWINHMDDLDSLEGSSLGSIVYPSLDGVLPNWPTMIAKIHRVLKVGGKGHLLELGAYPMASSTTTLPNVWIKWREILQRFGFDIGMTESWRREMESAGFGVTQTRRPVFLDGNGDLSKVVRRIATARVEKLYRELKWDDDMVRALRSALKQGRAGISFDV